MVVVKKSKTWWEERSTEDKVVFSLIALIVFVIIVLLIFRLPAKLEKFEVMNKRADIFCQNFGYRGHRDVKLIQDVYYIVGCEEINESRHYNLDYIHEWKENFETIQVE